MQLEGSASWAISASGSSICSSVIRILAPVPLDPGDCERASLDEDTEGVRDEVVDNCTSNT